MQHPLPSGALDSAFFCSEATDLRVVQGVVFQCYLKPVYHLFDLLNSMDLYAVHYVSIASCSSLEGWFYFSMCEAPGERI
jgi:hypothetical protein